MKQDDTTLTAEEIVAARWEYLLAEGESDDLVRLDVVRAAYAEPRLRRLFVGVSHGVLYFSLSSESPYSLVGGTVYYLENDRYYVRGVPTLTGLGETDSLDEAFTLLADNIPADAGPLVVGRGVALPHPRRDSAPS
ncbi:DUF6193 family natural product biosynthesis protein [Streptomyces sp. NPDC058953]|uniref:DUF6193 family natural product biosynthesis protein n=1 Tax=unclassified Streptomyces TaxID=2593676 RepID=UPI0036C677E2